MLTLGRAAPFTDASALPQYFFANQKRAVTFWNLFLIGNPGKIF